LLRTALLPLLAIFLIPCFLPPAQAASSLDVLDRERDRTRAEPLSRPKIQIDQDRQASPLASAIQFTLGSLHVNGATVFSEAELLAPYIGMQGKQASFETLNAIAADLTKKYRDAGYLLSRVVLPAQEVDQHKANIQFTAIEGFVSSVEYSGDSRVVDRFKSYFSSAENRLLGQKPLQHKDFEREMLLMQDVSGVKISSRFQEGQVPGGSVLVIDVQGDLIDGSAGWGNTGTESSGPGMLSVSMGVNTIPLIGARTTLSYSQANDYREYYSIQAAQSYRFSNGLNLHGSYAFSSSQKPHTEFARLFDYETRSYTIALGMSYPLIRSRDMNLSIGIDYDHRDSEADLLDERFTRDRLRNLSYNANFDFSDTWGGVTQLITTLYQGLHIFEATDKYLESSSPLAGAQFFKADFYVSRNQQLPLNLSVFTAAEAQFSDSPLSSYNKFSFGGSQFGRGYDPGLIEADNAFAVSLEPRWTYYLNDKTAIQPFTFIDYGTLWTSRSVEGLPDEEHASSWGGGIRFWGHVGDEILPDFNLSAFIGLPIGQSRGRHDMSHRFVVQATLLF
jgi:hemolysin activation/secretion protein